MQENKKQKRDHFSSQLGIILASAGSAIGLGNIWRFSYITGVNGGGAFLIIYLICVFLVGLPIMIAELTVGRRTRKSPVSAFKQMAPKSFWTIGGTLGVLGAFLIMTYYPVISGWSLGYVWESITNWQAVAADPAAAFTAYTSGYKPLIMQVIAIAITAYTLSGGVSKGIEKWSKILMPALFVIILVLIVRSLTLPGAVEGVKFLFYPDFSKLTLGSFLDALGHSFYSLSVGMGIMITYGSYIKRKDDLVTTTASVVALDTGIALLAGLAIFPAVFALGVDPTEGAGLAFITLPGAFATLPMGGVFAALFFLLLTISAVTSMMGLMQVLLAYVHDEWGISKNKGIAIFSVLLFLLGIPAALSFGVLADFKIFGLTYFDFMDKVTANLTVPLAGLFCALLVVFKFGAVKSRDEFLSGAKNQNSFIAKVYPFAIQFVAPVAVVLILLNATGLFSKLFGA